MNRNPSRLSPQRGRAVKGLTLACCFTLVASLLVSGWFGLTSGYSAVMKAEDISMIQLDAPQSGAPTAVMHTDLGDLTFLLYPEECPETVASFRALAESGYYNGSYVFRVEPGTFFEGGSPNPDGAPAADAAGTPQERIPRELTPRLWPIRGALCAVTTAADAGFLRTLFGSQKYYTGSRFLVVDTVAMDDEMQQGLHENSNLTAVADAFIEKGGIPNFSQQMTVFGQLIEGFDVLDAITDAETVTGEDSLAVPKAEIRIQSVEISAVP